MTVNSRIIKTFLQWSPDAVDVPLMNGLRVQILPTIEDLPKARKHQFAAFIAAEQLLVVWDDEAMNLVPRAKAIEKELMELVWKTGQEEGEEDADGPPEKKGPAVVEVTVNEETGEFESKRPTNIQNSVLVGCTLTIVTILLGLGFRQLAVEVAVDKGYARLAFIILTPVQVFFTLVSPVQCTQRNSRSLTICLVLCSSHRWLYRAIDRTHQADDRELTILLRSSTPPNRRPPIAPRHRPVSRIQGGSRIRHCPDRQVSQAGYLHLRIARWLSQHLHQRRWSPDHFRRGTSSSYRFLR